MKIACVIIWLVLVAMSVGIHLAKHGEPRTDKYNFWTGLLTAAIEVGLMWGAGIFDVFK